MTLLGVFGVVFFAAIFWLSQPAPKVEAACGAECVKDSGVCKSDDTTWGTAHDTCTINIGLDFYNTASGTSACSSGSGASRRECLQDTCPNIGVYAPLNGKRCDIMTGNSNWLGACIDPKIKATGVWDGSKSKCISCLGNKEFSVCGNTRLITVNNSGACIGTEFDSGKFETACDSTVDNACDDQAVGFDCGSDKTCDTNGECVSSASCTYNNPTISLNPLSKTGTAGSTQTYTISVINNNTAACANETFTLTGTVPSGWTSSVSPTSTVTLSSGQVMTRTFNVTSAATAAPNTYNVSVAASATKNGTGSGQYVISAGGFASYKDSVWYSLKYDGTTKTCSSVCSGAAPPNNSCSNPGACQTGGVSGSIDACKAYATCANDQEACKCPTAEICNNGIDDNSNGLADCKDVGFCPTGSSCGVGGKTCDASGTCSGGGPVSSPLCQSALVASDVGKLCGTRTVLSGDIGGFCCSTENFVAADKAECQRANSACAGTAPPPSCTPTGPENCATPGDEDCNNLADTADPACAVTSVPPGPCASGTTNYRSPLSYCSIQDLIQGATGWILGLVSSIAILFLVYGGIMYTMAAGDETKMESAKNIIYYAILGLAIILISYTLITEVKTILKVK